MRVFIDFLSCLELTTFLGRGIESLSTARVMGYITYRTIRKEKQFFR